MKSGYNHIFITNLIKEEKMLHAKNYFSFFGMLANSVNAKLMQLVSSFRQLRLSVMPMVTDMEQKLKNAVKNQTKIQK